jgi:hypothetical protein
VETRRDVAAGEELTMDYNVTACACGSSGCGTSHTEGDRDACTRAGKARKKRRRR